VWSKIQQEVLRSHSVTTRVGGLSPACHIIWLCPERLMKSQLGAASIPQRRLAVNHGAYREFFDQFGWRWSLSNLFIKYYYPMRSST